MREIGIELLLESPALLSAAPPAANFIETLHSVPGNVVRGILAHRYLDLGGQASDEVFGRLFLGGDARFGWATSGASHPIPLSARSCKYDGGFRRDGRHGVIDLLLAHESDRSCPECGATLDYAQGFWDPRTRRECRVRTRVITRTAIDSARGAARTGQLYSQETLVEGQLFAGNVEVHDALYDHLAGLLAQPFSGRLGRGASRGQGWIQVRTGGMPGAELVSARERFDRFQKRLGRPMLALTLLSDGLFADDYFRDLSRPALSHLVSMGIEPDEWLEEPLCAFAETRTVFGFDGEPLHLPRIPRRAVIAGSTFLFAARPGVDGPVIPNGDGTAWIGDGAIEGYGRAVLWYPFHLDPEEMDK